MTRSAITPAVLEWTEQGHPYSTQFADIYFSNADGLQESQYVFLQQNQLPQRILTHAEQRPFTIAELGFGSGLNFLLTWQACLANNALTPQRPLHYLAIEKHPLKVDDLAKILATWPSLQDLSAILLAHYPSLVQGCHVLSFNHGLVQLQLWFGDVAQILPVWSDAPTGFIDSWFLDGFAPARNPEMWAPTLYQHMARLSRPHAQFSTFTASGQVRRGLTTAGFVVEKVAGFGSKREMLRGHWPDESTRTSSHAPWFNSLAPAVKESHALIIGGGLAGCHCAYSLSQRGWQCTVIEQQTQLAGGSSGNRQGAFYPLLTRHWRDLSTQFYLPAFLTALRCLQQLVAQGASFAHEFCGVLQLGVTPNSHTRLSQIAEQLSLPEDLMQWVSAAQAEALSGLNLQCAGLWFPNGGWVSPPQLCQALLSAAQQHTTQTVLFGQTVQQLSRHSGIWQALDQYGQVIASAPVVILANAYEASYLQPALPLATVRGQVSYPTATDESALLKTVLCHEGYVTPAWEDMHCVGATYDPEETSLQVRVSDNISNANSLARSLSALAAVLPLPEETPAQCGLRCVTPDHLPIVGMVPDYTEFLQQYGDLAHGRAAAQYTAPTASGLYVSAGHGSRGLISAPLAAEIITAQLTGGMQPLAVPLLQALAPQRFWVRQLKRAQVG